MELEDFNFEWFLKVINTCEDEEKRREGVQKLIEIWEVE